MPADLRKIAIIGAGSVGSAAAYAVMMSGLVSEMVLVDADKDRALGEAMDLAHGASFIRPIRINPGDYADCLDADIIVFAAGAGQKPGESRIDLMYKNYKVLQQVLPKVMPAGSNSILLIVSNPVDLLTYAALQVTGFPPEKVIGSGTVLDSSRFRHLLGEHCRVAPRNIHAYVVGEHGDSEVPVWSTASIAGMPVEDFCSRRGLPYPDREAFSRQVREAAYEVIRYKGATYYAIGLAVRRICEGILRDENSILTVSGMLMGEYGISNVCMSLPSLINRRGRVQVLAAELSPEEEEALRRSGAILGSLQQEMEYGCITYGGETLLPGKGTAGFAQPVSPK